MNLRTLIAIKDSGYGLHTNVHTPKGWLAGWCGLLHGEMSERYGAPALQYMIAGDSHGKGLATELAHAVVQNALVEMIAQAIVATVDIPNIGSIRILEKLGFARVGQVHAYGSNDMYLCRLGTALNPRVYDTNLAKNRK